MPNTAAIALLLALLFRYLVSLHPYSGQNKPPLYGDYEAQRHWMEITANLPASEWYRNGTHNDLLYWGLDYPPLTAYHSYLMGRIAQVINPDWVQLNVSRGYESYHHKFFMRSTVFFTDLLIYITALFIYWNSTQSKPDLKFTYLLRSLISPAIILIDNGHFQYNSISLGFILWTIILLRKEKDIAAAVVFCLALNYKQMSLYYSLPIFFYLLKRCFCGKDFLSIGSKFISLGLTVLATFAMLWLPFLSNIESVLHVVTRIFPLNRGIYEDKVANFWYCISIFVKVKSFFQDNQLALISASLTLIISAPVCYMLFRKNTIQMLKYSLVNVSLAFFMFSFQVHEKTILFVTSVLMLLCDTHPFLVFWFDIISTFSLQPLLIKDNLMTPFFALIIVYLTVGQNTLRYNDLKTNFLFAVSILGAAILSISSLTMIPPVRFPHIHVLLNCFYSFLHFSSFLFYFLYKQYDLYLSLPQQNSVYIKTKIKKK